MAGNPPLTFALKLDPEHPYRLERGAWLTPEIVAEFGLGFCSRGMMQGCYCGPIADEDGQTVAYFGRRICPAEEIPEGQGKYVLPPREKFDRSLELYNLHRAIQRRGDRVVIVEGFFGAIRAFVALDVPVVATMGNSISDAQIALVARHFARATLLYDGGENGRQAADRAALRLCRARIPTDIADLPDGPQPDTVEATVLGELLARPA